VIVRDARPDDARAIVDLYNHYVTHTTITFEEQPVSPSEMESRVREIQSGGLPWLVAEESGVVVGYAYASKWKTRSAYRFSVESTVYVAHDRRTRGVGTSLYEVLIARLKDAGYHTVIGGITQPNEASVRLHERLGFVKTAHFREVGFKFGEWLDVAYWQRPVDIVAASTRGERPADGTERG